MFSCRPGAVTQADTHFSAAYATDGYARLNEIGALVTTFGVGELSAINGVAGAFSEHVALVHIVGCPSTLSQRDGMLLHHTLGNGDFNVFANMSANISCYVAKLNDPAEIATQIDHALRQCWVHCRPIYIMFPTDMVKAQVEGGRLQTQLDLSDPPNDPEIEDHLVDVISTKLQAAKRPMILVDACAIRHRVLAEVQELVSKTKLPVFVTPMGKGAINEQLPNFGGVYAGLGSHPPQVKDMLESSDLILTIGALKVCPSLSPYTLQALVSSLTGSYRAISTRQAFPIERPSSKALTCTAITALSDMRHIPVSG